MFHTINAYQSFFAFSHEMIMILILEIMEKILNCNKRLLNFDKIIVEEKSCMRF